jgi:tRNA G18 (ribose-2'-O)-methylase SpoU
MGNIGKLPAMTHGVKEGESAVRPNQLMGRVLPNPRIKRLVKLTVMEPSPKHVAKESGKKRSTGTILVLVLGLFGLHAVEAALLNPLRQIRAVYVTEAAEEHAYKFVDAARSIGLDRPEPVIIDAEAFERALPKATVHQGIGLDCSPLDDTFLPDLIHQAEARGKSLVVLLDK